MDRGAAGIEDRRFHGPAEEFAWMAAEELIEGVFAGDVHGKPAAPASSAAPHLPEAGDRARERDADRRIELADVDAQLERVGGDHAEQLALSQPALDLLALSRRIARAVGSDSLAELGLQAVAGMAEDQLDALSRLDEADRAGAL